MVHRVQHEPVAGPRVADPATPGPGQRVLRTARTTTGLVVLAATVVTVAASITGGVGSTLVRVCFVGLWLALPWLLTEGATHLSRRAGTPARLVEAVGVVAWASAVGAVTAVTPRMFGAPVSPGWGLAGAAAAVALLVVGARLTAPAPPAADADDAWLRGPFLD